MAGRLEDSQEDYRKNHVLSEDLEVLLFGF